MSLYQINAVITITKEEKPFPFRTFQTIFVYITVSREHKMEISGLIEVYDVFLEKPQMFGYLFLGILLLRWLYKTIGRFILIGVALMTAIIIF